MSKKIDWYYLEEYYNKGDNDDYKLGEKGFEDEYVWSTKNSFGNNKVSMTISKFIRYLESYGYTIKKESTYKDFNDLLSDWSGKTTVFVYHCQDCGKLCYTTLNTINYRKGLVCKECFKQVGLNAIKVSLEDVAPELVSAFVPNEVFTSVNYKFLKSNSDLQISFKCDICGKITKRTLKRVLEGSDKPVCQRCLTFKTNLENGSSRSVYDVSTKLAEMFDKGENGINSRSVPSMSAQQYNWMCLLDKNHPHVFRKNVQNMIHAIESGSKYVGCPYCSGHLLLKGFNDFETKNPEMAKYWDYNKNKLNPCDVQYSDETKYWFVCPKGHSYLKDPLHMMRSIGVSTQGCPYCHGKIVAKGVNDAATRGKGRLKYWDYEKNNGIISPEEVTYKSNRIAWFKCVTCGKSYQARICEGMTGLVINCENCRNKGTSMEEIELRNCISNLVKARYTLFPNRYFAGYELDTYVKELRLDIEYNGLYWHSTNIKKDPYFHYMRYLKLKEHNISTLAVWQDDYINRTEVVIHLLKAKLNLLSVCKREWCSLRYINEEEASKFFKKYHISGFEKSDFYIGYILSNEVLSLASFNINGSTLLLTRFAEKQQVSESLKGILSDLMDTGKYTGVEVLLDNSYQSGEMYYSMGFEVRNIVNPRYWLFINNRRVNPEDYTLNEYRRDFGYDIDESNLLKLYNDLPRVYDYGYTKLYGSFY